MAYANRHILIRLLGHFGASAAPVDQWSTGIRFAIIGADVPTSPTALQTFVDACATAAKVFHAAAAVQAGTACYLVEVTGARIGLDGKYDPLTQETVRNTFTPTPGTGSIVQPWSTAGVISLRASVPRGYAHNGRVYYPWTAAAIGGSTGRIAAGDVTNRITAFKTMLDAMNVAAATYATNMKAAILSNVGSGTTRLVSSIRSDNRLDSIERRENKQPSTWQTATIA